MNILFERITSFFMSLCLLLGMFGADAGVKSRTSVAALTLREADIAGGLTVTVPARAGTVRFNRVSFAYSATAPVRGLRL